MLRFLFRLLAMVALAFAVIYGVIDIARSIADGGIVLTTFAETSFLVAPEWTEDLIERVELGQVRFLTSERLATLLSIPTSLGTLALSIIFFLIGRKPGRRKGRFSMD